MSDLKKRHFGSMLSCCSPSRLSFASVVFDFSASLNDVAPVSPMPLPVVMKRKVKSDLLMDVFCVSCLHYSDRVE